MDECASVLSSYCNLAFALYPLFMGLSYIVLSVKQCCLSKNKIHTKETKEDNSKEMNKTWRMCPIHSTLKCCLNTIPLICRQQQLMLMSVKNITYGNA